MDIFSLRTLRSHCSHWSYSSHSSHCSHRLTLFTHENSACWLPVQMRGEWFDAVSCCVTFSRASMPIRQVAQTLLLVPRMLLATACCSDHTSLRPQETMRFRHAIVRPELGDRHTDICADLQVILYTKQIRQHVRERCCKKGRRKFVCYQHILVEKKKPGQGTGRLNWVQTAFDCAGKGGGAANERRLWLRTKTLRP